MNSASTWQRVSKRRPCPVCERPDWCMYAGPDDSPTAVICPRIESAKRCGEGGWLHRLRDDREGWESQRRIRTRTVAVAPVPAVDLAKLAADCRAAVKPEALDTLAESLGVSADSLRRLGIGWSARHGAWSFPMTDATGNVLGIRLRLPGGKKLSVTGGHEGLFVPEGFDAPSLLLVCEGPTDTAALLDLGFSAVGRPNCAGGMAILVKMVQQYRPEGVVIVADADAPGQRGAENLAIVLLAYSASVRVIAPPPSVKDAREWKRQGATHADVQAAIDAAPVRRLAISTRIRGKAGHDAK